MSLFIAVLANLASIQGSDVDNRPILWGGIRLGMTPEEAKVLYPKNKIAITDKCSSYVYSERDKQKLVKSVVLGHVYAFPLGTRCGAIVRDGLIEKYGDPVAKQTTLSGNDSLETLRFEKGALTIVFKAQPAVADDKGMDQYIDWEVKYLWEPSRPNVADKL